MDGGGGGGRGVGDGSTEVDRVVVVGGIKSTNFLLSSLR